MSRESRSISKIEALETEEINQMDPEQVRNRLKEAGQIVLQRESIVSLRKKLIHLHERQRKNSDDAENEANGEILQNVANVEMPERIELQGVLPVARQAQTRKSNQ